MAERARPVTVSERQSGGTTGLAPRITSTTSPFCSGGAQRLQLAVDLHPDGGVADVGVDGVGEVQRHGAARQADQLALGREDEDLVEEHLELGVLDQLLDVAAVLQHLDQVAQVDQRVAPAAGLLAASASKP